MAELTQDKRIASLTIPALGEDIFVLTHFEGAEALGELFEFRVEALSERQNFDFTGVIGEHCSVKINTYGSARIFDGLLVEAQWLGQRETYQAYRLVLRPWLWMLSHRSTCRIFHEQSVTDIIRHVFEEAGYSDHDLRLTESYPTLEYCVQYNESDFAFVSRLMELWGIYYFFEHQDGKHTLVLCDAMSSHAEIPGLATLPYRPVIDQGQRDHELLYQWSSERRFRANRFRLNDYNHEQSNADMVGRAQGAGDYNRSDFELYHYPGRYENRELADRFAKIRLQAEQAADRHSHASGDAISLFPGGKFTLDPRPRGVEESQFLVLRTSHSLATEHYRSTGGAGGGGEAYYGHYEFLPIDQPFRSPAVTPKAHVRGPQTAVVTDGAESDPDGHGRILVRFHWYPNRDDSRRVRVAQVWADNDWGACFFPRVGQEVVVDFLHGDPDQPLVIGAVYNDRHQMPYTEPRSGWKSERNNQIAFDDTHGAEELYLRAEKDMKVEVTNEQKTIAQQKLALESYGTIELMVGMTKITMNGGTITLQAPVVKIDAAIVKVSGILQADILMASSAVISPAYTPGAGNIW